MKVFESIFDITYLSLVIGLGVRLLIEEKKDAKLFGLMAILLGLGDSFHLLPRIISHLSPEGFEGHIVALSWGQFVTSITMTIFYILYYYYYMEKSGDRDKTKTILVYLLAAFRIGITLMPQNGWGTANPSYAFGIYRNIPFAILGGLLIYWTHKHNDKEGLKHMDLLIFLSFIFYIPVVLWSKQYPAVGAFMLPKTFAYLMIVVVGYKHYVKEFKAENILGLSFTMLIMGLVAGVFYREFTKYYGFINYSHLRILHVHTLVLGFFALLILFSIVKRYTKEEMTSIKKPFHTYMTGLISTVVMMMLIGIYEVVSKGQNIVNPSMLAGISGLAHTTLGVGIVWLLKCLVKIERNHSVYNKIETAK